MKTHKVYCKDCKHYAKDKFNWKSYLIWIGTLFVLISFIDFKMINGISTYTEKILSFIFSLWIFSLCTLMITSVYTTDYSCQKKIIKKEIRDEPTEQVEETREIPYWRLNEYNDCEYYSEKL